LILRKKNIKKVKRLKRDRKQGEIGKGGKTKGIGITFNAGLERRGRYHATGARGEGLRGGDHRSGRTWGVRAE